MLPLIFSTLIPAARASANTGSVKVEAVTAFAFAESIG
jgi:hypothetical protein